MLTEEGIGKEINKGGAAAGLIVSAGDEVETGADGILTANNEINLGEKLLGSWNVR